MSLPELMALWAAPMALSPSCRRSSGSSLWARTVSAPGSGSRGPALRLPGCPQVRKEGGGHPSSVHLSPCLRSSRGHGMCMGSAPGQAPVSCGTQAAAGLWARVGSRQSSDTTCGHLVGRRPSGPGSSAEPCFYSRSRRKGWGTTQPCLGFLPGRGPSPFQRAALFCTACPRVLTWVLQCLPCGSPSQDTDTQPVRPALTARRCPSRVQVSEQPWDGAAELLLALLVLTPCGPAGSPSSDALALPLPLMASIKKKNRTEKPENISLLRGCWLQNIALVQQ